MSANTELVGGAACGLALLAIVLVRWAIRRRAGKRRARAHTVEAVGPAFFEGDPGPRDRAAPRRVGVGLAPWREAVPADAPWRARPADTSVATTELQAGEAALGAANRRATSLGFAGGDAGGGAYPSPSAHPSPTFRLSSSVRVAGDGPGTEHPGSLLMSAAEPAFEAPGPVGGPVAPMGERRPRLAGAGTGRASTAGAGTGRARKPGNGLGPSAPSPPLALGGPGGHGARAPARPLVLTAIVTGASGPASVAVIRALQQAGHRVVAADPDGLAAGLRLADGSALVPRLEDPTFAESVCELATAVAATVLVPTVAEHIVALAPVRERLQEVGVASWLPSAAAVETCVDRWRLVQVLSAKGLPVPVTGLGTADGVPGAWAVRSRRGAGCGSACFVDRRDDLAGAMERVPDPIVQTRLVGREFVVDALVDRRGQLAGAVPSWELERRAGIATKARTFADPALCRIVADALAAVGLSGPAHLRGVQGGDGSINLLGVSPGFSDGLPLSVAAGADLVGEYVRGILGKPVVAKRLTHRVGVTMIRHFEEVFE